MCECRFAMLNENRQLNRVEWGNCMRCIKEEVTPISWEARDTWFTMIQAKNPRIAKKNPIKLSAHFLYVVFCCCCVLSIAKQHVLKLVQRPIIQIPHDSLQLFFSHRARELENCLLCAQFPRVSRASALFIQLFFRIALHCMAYHTKSWKKGEKIHWFQVSELSAYWKMPIKHLSLF